MSTKKQRAEFRQEVEKLIQKYGGTIIEGNSYPWLMETRYGPLRLVIDDEDAMGRYAKKYLGTVFTRFSIPSPPHRQTGCSPYTGKWNFHFYQDHTVKQAIEYIEGQFEEMKNA